MKGIEYSELHAIAHFSDSIMLKQSGRNSFIHDIPNQQDFNMANLGFNESRVGIQSGKYDIVILDEANVAIHFQLFPVQKLLTLMAEKPAHVELLITGRYASPQVIEKADLVTDMFEVKHYYQKGITTGKGIES